MVGGSSSKVAVFGLRIDGWKDTADSKFLTTFMHLNSKNFIRSLVLDF